MTPLTFSVSWEITIEQIDMLISIGLVAIARETDADGQIVPPTDQQKIDAYSAYMAQRIRFLGEQDARAVVQAQALIQAEAQVHAIVDAGNITISNI